MSDELHKTVSVNIFVLSPHRDDAAFSLSISIDHWLRRGHAVQIVNVFTRSQYAPLSGAEMQLAEDRVGFVSQLRREEDERFLKVMQGATLVDLDLNDAPIRLGCDSSQVCAMEVPSEDEAIPAIHDRLLLLTMVDDAALVLPLALGRHVDHLTARDAALPLVETLPCAFYEDLPYATRAGARSDLSELRQMLSRQHQVTIAPVLCYGAQEDAKEFKLGNALLYASQIGAEEAEPIADFCHRYGGGERLWANTRWVVAAEAAALTTSQVDPEGYPLPA